MVVNLLELKTNYQAEKELALLAELLEKCYIHSTDIEYSQFYMKELAIMAEKGSQNYKQKDKIGSIKIEANKIFDSLEMKKSQYFKENIKELSGSIQIMQSVNLELKQKRDELIIENSELKDKLNFLEKKIESKERTDRTENVKANLLLDIEKLENEIYEKDQKVLEMINSKKLLDRKSIGLESENLILKNKIDDLIVERNNQIREISNLQTQQEKELAEVVNLLQEKEYSESKIQHEESLLEQNLIKLKQEIEFEKKKGQTLENQLNEARRELKQKIKEHELNEINKNNESQKIIYELKITIETLEQQLKVEKKLKNQESNLKEEFEDQLENLQKKIKNIQNNKYNDDQEKENEIDNLKLKLKNAKKNNLIEIDELKEEIENLNKSNKKLQKENQELNQNESLFRSEISQLKSKLNLIEKKMNDLENEKQDKLSLNDTLQKEINNYELKIVEMQKKENDLIKELTDIRSRVKELCELLLETKNKMKNQENKFESLKKDKNKEISLLNEISSKDKNIIKNLEFTIFELQNVKKEESNKKYSWNLNKFYTDSFLEKKDELIQNEKLGNILITRKMNTLSKFQVLPLLS